MTAIRALYLVVGLGVAVVYPFLAVILASRGFDPTAIGLVLGLTSLASIVAMPAWGHVADAVVGRVRALQLAALGSAACLAAFALPLPGAVLVALLVGFQLFQAAIQPVTDALAVNALPDPGRQYGAIRVLSSASFAVGAVAAGLVYGAFGYGPAGVGYALVVLPIVAVAPRIVDRDRARLRTRRGGAMREALAVQPRLPAMLAAIVLVYVGVMAGLTFLALRIVAVGGGPEEVAVATALAAVTEVPAMIAAGRLAPRVGLRALFAASGLTYAVAFAVWAVAADPATLIASNVLAGVGFSGLWMACVLGIQAVLPPALQASGQGLYQLAGFGVAALVANLGGGILYGRAGAGLLFGLSAAAAVVGAAGGWLAFPRRPVSSVPAPPGEPAGDAPVSASAGNVEEAEVSR